MSRLYQSPAAKALQPQAYYAFRGIDRSRDITNMETNEKQHFWELNNCHVDYRGRILRDPPLYALHKGDQAIAVRFYSLEGLIWAARDQASISIRADNGAELKDIYPRDANVRMINFKGRTMICAQGEQMYHFDGYTFFTSKARIQPAFLAPIQRRVAAAGFPDRPQVVEFSRVDQEEIFLDQEDAQSEAPNKAAFIDISNLINSADRITGLGAFEANRLAIFTNDQVLVYFIDPDFNEWRLDTRASIRIGCISHDTIQQAGTDLIFASRTGIHSLMRSEANGLTLSESILSEDVEPLYRELIRSVEDPQSISAIYDPDAQSYHIFFPQPGGVICKRLTMNFRSGYELVNFSTGDTLNMRCGAFLAGRLVTGTSDGVYETLDRFFKQDIPLSRSLRSAMHARTPILWLGDFVNETTTDSLILQASGEGVIFIDAYDEADALMETIRVDLSSVPGDAFLGSTRLKDEMIFPFQHQFRGVQLAFRTEDGDPFTDVVITSFAILENRD